MNWEIHQGTETFAEYHESEAGRVEHCGASGWDVWVYIPDALRKGHATKPFESRGNGASKDYGKV